MSETPDFNQAKPVKEQLISISVQGLPFSEFVRLVQDSLNSQITIIYQEGLADKIVYLDAVDQPVGSVLSKLARRFQVNAIREGTLWYFGELKPEDRATYTSRVPRLSKEEIQAAVTTMISNQGRVWASNDGLLHVSDSVEILERVQSFVEQLRNQESPTWVVQLYLVNSSERTARNLGINVDHLVRYSYNYATGSGLRSIGSEVLNASLDAVLVAAYERGDTTVQARPLLLLSDGEQAYIRNGQRFPVPRRTENIETGVVSITGYDYIQTGLSVDVQLRENSDTHASLIMKVKNSQVTGFVNDEVPITLDEELLTTASVRSSGVYLLGALDVAVNTDTRAGPGFTTSFGTQRQDNLTLIWCRCYRVAGLREPAPAKETQKPKEIQTSGSAPMGAQTPSQAPDVETEAALTLSIGENTHQEPNDGVVRSPSIETPSETQNPVKSPEGRNTPSRAPAHRTAGRATDEEETRLGDDRGSVSPVPLVAP